MVDIVVTPANVRAGANAQTKVVKSAAAILAGQVVYKAADGRYGLMDSDSVTAEARIPAGIALNSAPGADMPLTIQYAGDIVIGGTVVVGTVYVASDTAGGLMPTTDLEPGDFVTVMGVGISATTIRLSLIVSGVAVP